MRTTGDGFLEDIRQHPNDDAVRLIYADWLDEQGDEKRAQLIRVECELARLPVGDSRRKELEAEGKKLLSEDDHALRKRMLSEYDDQFCWADAHEKGVFLPDRAPASGRYYNAFPNLDDIPYFERGFVSRPVDIDFNRRHHELDTEKLIAEEINNAALPLKSIILTNSWREPVNKMLRSISRADIQECTLRSPIIDTTIKALEKAAFAHNLQHLRLEPAEFGYMDPNSLKAISLPSLKRLTIATDIGFPPGTLESFLENPGQFKNVIINLVNPDLDYERVPTLHSLDQPFNVTTLIYPLPPFNVTTLIYPLPRSTLIALRNHNIAAAEAQGIDYKTPEWLDAQIEALRPRSGDGPSPRDR